MIVHRLWVLRLKPFQDRINNLEQIVRLIVETTSLLYFSFGDDSQHDNDRITMTILFYITNLIYLIFLAGHCFCRKTITIQKTSPVHEMQEFAEESEGKSRFILLITLELERIQEGEK